MVKLIPLSIVIATIVVPIALAQRPRPKRTMRVLYLVMALLAFIWAMLCLHVYPVYVLPE